MHGKAQSARDCSFGKPEVDGYGPGYTGSKAEINQAPLSLVNATFTALPLNDPSGLSLLVVVWLRNTKTTAESGFNSDTAALTTTAEVLTCFCLAAGDTMSCVNCV